MAGHEGQPHPLDRLLLVGAQNDRHGEAAAAWLILGFPYRVARLWRQRNDFTMKRVQLQLPEAVVDWIDRNAADIESRASFVRRTLVQVMRGEERRLPPCQGDNSGRNNGSSDRAAAR